MLAGNGNLKVLQNCRRENLDYISLLHFSHIVDVKAFPPTHITCTGMYDEGFVEATSCHHGYQ
jgi:hypothetical protein